jgi:hypothetical protein
MADTWFFHRVPPSAPRQNGGAIVVRMRALAHTST